MRFPPIKPDRALLWVSLIPDETAADRYAALQAILTACRLHPFDTTGGALLVIIDPALLRARLDDVRAALGPGDLLHLITALEGRLNVEVIAGADAAADDIIQRPAARRPPWLAH